MKNLIFLTLLSLSLTISTPVFSQVSNQDSAVQITQSDGTAPTWVAQADRPALGDVGIGSATPDPVAKVSFFAKLWNNAKESGIWVIVMYVFGILSKNGITKVIKAIAGKTTIVTKELSDVSLAVSNFASLVDKAIKDDGAVDQNSLKEASAAGKTVMVETKEAWLVIKPKPATVVPAV